MRRQRPPGRIHAPRVDRRGSRARWSSAFRRSSGAGKSRGTPVGRRAADARDRARTDRAAARSLLLDEPSLGLAPALIDELYRVLAELARPGHDDPARRPDGGAGALGRRSRLRDGVGPRSCTRAPPETARRPGARDAPISAEALRDGDGSRPAQRAHRRDADDGVVDIGIAGGRIVGDRATRTQPASGNRCSTAGCVVAGLRRDAHSSRQGVHPGPLQARARHAGRGDRAGRRGEASVHRRTTCHAREPRARAGDPATARRALRTHVEVDPGIGLRGFDGREARRRRVSLGGRHRDLRVSAGRADRTIRAPRS